MEQLVSEIVLSDQKTLKEEKVYEWEKGLRPNNTLIGNYRDPEYAIFKQQLNPLANGHVDLLYTRQTARSLFVQKGTKERGFIFGMNDVHNLVGRYGLYILGLNEETFLKRQNDIYKFTLVYKIKKDYKIA